MNYVILSRKYLINLYGETTFMRISIALHYDITTIKYLLKNAVYKIPIIYKIKTLLNIELRQRRINIFQGYY